MEYLRDHEEYDLTMAKLIFRDKVNHRHYKKYETCVKFLVREDNPRALECGIIFRTDAQTIQ